MSTQFTPGPWESVQTPTKKGGPKYIIRQAKPRYEKNPHMQHARLLIAETYSHRFGCADNVPGDGMNDLAHADKEGCQQANARLIAAAPDLFAALAGVLELVSRTPVGSHWPDDVDERCDTARAALAKARGEEPEGPSVRDLIEARKHPDGTAAAAHLRGTRVTDTGAE